MKTKQIQEQIQEDLLCLLESYGIEETLPPEDYEDLKTLLCNVVIDNLKKLENEPTI